MPALTDLPTQAPRFSIARLPQNARSIVANLANRWRRRGPMVGLPRSLVVLAILLLAMVIAILPYDQSISRWAKSLPRWMIDVAPYLTQVGTDTNYLVAAGILLICLGMMDIDRNNPCRFNQLVSWVGLVYLLVFALLASEIVCNALKFVVGRPRPFAIDQHGMGGVQPLGSDALLASFPSGHSADIAVIATILSLVFRKWTALFLLVAIVVGGTRVVMQKHYPSDVLAGFCVGILIATVLASVFARLRYVFMPSASGSFSLKPSFRLTVTS